MLYHGGALQLLNLLMLATFLSINVSFILHGTFIIDNAWEPSSIDDALQYSSRSPVENVSDRVTTSACLYIMDDNHFLIEWLAYHYHATNLRHLILTTDPHSLTSPQRILDRWKDRISIELWTDHQFLPSDFDEIVHKRTFGSNGTKQKDPSLQYHRARQAAFNVECLKEHKRKNRDWTMVIDVDEYLTVNPDLLSTNAKNSRDLTRTVPPIETPGSVAEVFRHLKIPNPHFVEVKTPCVPVYRRQFSAVESEENVGDIAIPENFDPSSFQTLRWRKFGSESVRYTTRLGTECKSHREVPNKVVVDLGRLQLQDLDHPKNNGNPHNPLGSICPPDVYLPLEDTPLMANHYMGTKEQWLYRVGDKRGKGYRLARYEDLNSRIGEEATDQVRSWLRGFIDTVGEKEAAILLEDVGKLEPFPELEVSLEPVAEIKNTQDVPLYQVGDVVQADYKGDGHWYWAEIAKVHSNGYYNVFYLEDCSEEIATFEGRLRRTGTAEDSMKYDIDLQELALSGASRQK